MSELLKPRSTALADIFENIGEFDKTTGHVSFDKDAYAEHALPEGTDMKQVNAIRSNDEDVIVGLTEATARIAEAAMKKDSKLLAVTSELKIGKFGDINIGYQRSQERPKSITDRTPVTHYGTTTARVRTFGQKNKGELKKLRVEISERGAKLFS
jgi:hypothetical protein